MSAPADQPGSSGFAGPGGPVVDVPGSGGFPMKVTSPGRGQHAQLAALWATLPSFADSESSASSSAQAEISLRRGSAHECRGRSLVVRLDGVAGLRESGVRAGLRPGDDVRPALSRSDRQAPASHSEVARGFAGPNGACRVVRASRNVRRGRSQPGCVVCSSRGESSRPRE